MKLASIRLEAIGDDAAWRAKRREDYGLTDATMLSRAMRAGAGKVRAHFAEEKRYKERPRAWVARIVGRTSTGRYQYDFLSSHKDYSEANGTGSRGVMLAFLVPEGGPYEVSSPTTWKSAERYFCRVEGGEVVRIEREEVERMLDAGDQPLLARALQAPPGLPPAAPVAPAEPSPAAPAREDPQGPQKGPWNPRKALLGCDVVTAARARIAEVFEHFPRVYLSGPSGKDSSVMMHLVCQEARRRGRKVGVLYLDLEAQYALTVDHVREMFELYADVIEPYWVALPLHLRNAVSVHKPFWVSWDPRCPDAWVRQRERGSISDPNAFPFYVTPKGDEAMEFEEFIEHFGHWYAGGQPCACFVGIRAQESLNRWRAVAGSHARWGERRWTTWKNGTLYNAYPIYDWRTEDIWTFVGRERVPYNRIYDLMWQAGVPLSHQRICQPYGDDQRRGLWLFHLLEPETWTRVVARVEGARFGALYAGKRGNVLGNVKVELPEGMTSWRAFVAFLLDALPPAEAEHYRRKIQVFLHHYETRGYSEGIPEEGDPKEEARRKVPSWRRIAKVILKNDRLCKGLGFSQTASESYERYVKIMKKRQLDWRKCPV